MLRLRKEFFFNLLNYLIGIIFFFFICYKTFFQKNDFTIALRTFCYKRCEKILSNFIARWKELFNHFINTYYKHNPYMVFKKIFINISNLIFLGSKFSSSLIVRSFIVNKILKISEAGFNFERLLTYFQRFYRNSFSCFFLK